MEITNQITQTSKETNSFTLFARAVGRRKEAVAQVCLIQGTGNFTINGTLAEQYLQNNSYSLLAIKAPFEVLLTEENPFKPEEIDTVVKVQGGGLVGQAEAIKLGVARAVCLMNRNQETTVKKFLKDKGFLTVDARVKERRKYGLRKARKAPQYHKR